MSLLKTFIQSNDIDFVISVDDCFLSEDETQVQFELIENMTDSFDPYIELLQHQGFSVAVDQIIDQIKMQEDPGDSITELVQSMTPDQMTSCLNRSKLNTNTVFDYLDKRALERLLNSLKVESAIKDYKIISSVKEANQFDTSSITTNGILWLVDKDFENSLEGRDAGIQLAKNLIVKLPKNNYIYIVSGQMEENGNVLPEEYIDSLLNDEQYASFCYYISKEPIRKPNMDQVASALADGFRRRYTFLCMDYLGTLLKDSAQTAIVEVQKFKKESFNHVISQKTLKKGESCQDFLQRMLMVYFETELNKKMADGLDDIKKLMTKYEGLFDPRIAKDCSCTNELIDLRKKELFDYSVNPLYCEVMPGDIFFIDNKYYVLATQGCDTVLRDNKLGRNLSMASLFQIDNDKTSVANDAKHKVGSFETHTNAIIHCRDPITIPFYVLDLCTLNKVGECTIPLETIKVGKIIDRHLYSRRYLKWMEEKVIPNLKEYVEKHSSFKEKILAVASQIASGDDCTDTLNEVVNGHLTNPHGCNYEISNSEVKFSAKRVCRLNFINTLSIIGKNANSSSRIPLPFDFIN